MPAVTWGQERLRFGSKTSFSDDQSAMVLTLTRLALLNIIENKISALAPMAGGVSLVKLYLQANPIKDLSPLVNFVNLKEVWIFGTKVEDFSPLYPLTMPHKNSDGEVIELQILDESYHANRQI